MSSPYTAVILEHYRRPRNFGGLAEPDVVQELLNPLCGDRIRMELAIRDGMIAAAGFRGDACAICTAAASLLTGMVRGLPVASAAGLAADPLLDALESPIPESRLPCALLPLEALRAGLAGWGRASAR